MELKNHVENLSFLFDLLWIGFATECLSRIKFATDILLQYFLFRGVSDLFSKGFFEAFLMKKIYLLIYLNGKKLEKTVIKIYLKMLISK